MHLLHIASGNGGCYLQFKFILYEIAVGGEQLLHLASTGWFLQFIFLAYKNSSNDKCLIFCKNWESMQYRHFPPTPC